MSGANGRISSVLTCLMRNVRGVRIFIKHTAASGPHFIRKGNDPYGQNPYNSAPDFYSNVNQGFGEDNSGKATGSMVCGIISLILWCIPIAGLALSIVAITLGNKSKDSINGGRAKAGCIMGYIGLGLSVLNWIAGMFLRLS